MQTTALYVAGVLFLIMAALQLVRVIVKARIVVNDRINIPLGLSMAAAPTLFLLALYMFLAAGR